MNELEDIKLKALLQSMKLESPGEDFSARVMNKIFEESSILETIKAQRVLGKGFWIFILIFAVFMVVTYVVMSSGAQTGSETGQLIPTLNAGISESYNSFFSKLGSVPLSIAGILIAASILLFIDRIITSNQKIFAS